MDEELIGYRQAGEYLGFNPKTLSSYVSSGIGPRISHRVQDGQYNRPVFRKDELDRWRSNRTGQGKRTDLIKSNPEGLGEREEITVA